MRDTMNIQHINKVYFLGIGGIGMSAIARYFNSKGIVVSGYDRTPTALTTALENEGKDQPNEYLKKVLRQTECPILLVPENYNLPNKLLLAYDGKPDSVFAIKQFTYLFPQLNNWETKLITLEDEEEPLPHQELIEELAAKHFSNLTLEVVSSETAASFANWMAEQDDYLLVAGAYGRSELSNLFKKSFLAEVIEQHKTPIFVAHK